MKNGVRGRARRRWLGLKERGEIDGDLDLLQCRLDCPLVDDLIAVAGEVQSRWRCSRPRSRASMPLGRQIQQLRGRG